MCSTEFQLAKNHANGLGKWIRQIDKANGSGQLYFDNLARSFWCGCNSVSLSDERSLAGSWIGNFFDPYV